MTKADAIQNLVFGDLVSVAGGTAGGTKVKVATIICIHADYGYVAFTKLGFNPDVPYKETCEYIRVERVPVSSLGMFPFVRASQANYAILRMRRNNSCLEGVLAECRCQGLPLSVSLNLQAQLLAQVEQEGVTEDMRGQDAKRSSQTPPVNEPTPTPDAFEPEGRFYVYRIGGEGPKRIHSSYEKALQEAKRLASETKDCARFEVLRIVASVETVMQTKVDDYR